MNKGNSNIPKNVGVLLLMLLIIAGLTAVAFTGIDMVIFEIPSVYDGVKLGLDLRGGSIITYAPAAENVSKEQLDSVVAMLRQRVDAEGLNETVIYLSGGRIVLEIPSLDNPDEAVQKIGSTAKLEFRDYQDKVLLTGDAVEKAEAGYGTSEDGTSGYQVKLIFAEEYVDQWVEATKHAASQADGDNYIALFMDGQAVVNPDTGEAFKPYVPAKYASTGIGRDAVVTFGTSKTSAASANSFASFVRIGRLPFELSVDQLTTVGPTLGATSLNTSLMAAAIGLAIIILFMIAFYRLPGFIAAIALCLYTALVVIVLSAMRVNLTLPGIAGIILGIGMAVDANVVIFERIKEELRSGKTIKSAVDSGFRRALTAIIDSNITTIIAGIVLLYFGSGPIQGFAKTLLIGVVVSMITVLLVSRLLLKQTVSLGITKLWFYGVSDNGAAPFFERIKPNIVKNFRKFGIVSGIVCLFSLICLILLAFGVSLFNLDIDFVGGVSIQYETNQSLSDEDVNFFTEAVYDITGVNPSAPQRVGDTQVLIKTSELPAEKRTLLFDKLKERFPSIQEPEDTKEVGASMGRDLQRAAMASVLVAAVLMLLYITIRFQFSSGLAAVVALLHDVMFILAGYVVLQIPINMNFIAVVLTILGYSINSTIIVFDRVRENRRLMQKSTFIDVIDKGVKQTMLRNLNTTITTLLPVICLIVLGVPSIRSFAIPLAIGIVAGAYSSIFLSGSLWHRFRKAER